jgi:hypothetical protein
MCRSPPLASFAITATPPALQPVVPEFRHRLHQLPIVLFGRLHARVADERAGRHILVRPEPPARHTNRPCSLLVNQPHSLLQFPMPRLRRTAFRAAHAPVAAAPHVLARSRHACLRLGRAWLIPFLSLSCLITRDIGRRQPTRRMATPTARPRKKPSHLTACSSTPRRRAPTPRRAPRRLQSRWPSPHASAPVRRPEASWTPPCAGPA